MNEDRFQTTSTIASKRSERWMVERERIRYVMVRPDRVFLAALSGALLAFGFYIWATEAEAYLNKQKPAVVVKVNDGFPRWAVCTGQSLYNVGNDLRRVDTPQLPQPPAVHVAAAGGHRGWCRGE